MKALRSLRPLTRPRRGNLLARHPRARYFCSATPSKASAEATPEPAVSSNDTLVRGFVGGAAALALGIGGYYATTHLCTTQPFELPEISDEIFDENDNLVVVVLDGEPSESVQRRITELRNFLRDARALRHIRLYHTKQKPTGIPAAEGEEIKIMVYKGHRKEQMSFLDLPKEFLETFFVPRSEDPFPTRTAKGPQNIALTQFDEMVIAPSFQQPVLVQVYEDTCFMCFLMRPFIESFAKLDDVPFQFRRLNIDRNDFPEGFPVSRATPTFILYIDGKPQKWEEFKPNDLAAKLDAMPVAPSFKESLNALLPKVQERFQMFTACVMLQIDLEKLQNKASLVGCEEETDDKETFEKAVTAMILADMQRTDDMEQNLAFLESELKSLQEDVTVLADMLQVEVPPAARLRTNEPKATADTSRGDASDVPAGTPLEEQEHRPAVDELSSTTSDTSAAPPQEGPEHPAVADASSITTSDTSVASPREGQKFQAVIDESSLRTSEATEAREPEKEKHPATNVRGENSCKSATCESKTDAASPISTSDAGGETLSTHHMLSENDDVANVKCAAACAAANEDAPRDAGLHSDKNVSDALPIAASAEEGTCVA